jgi:hypothetical protein
MATVPTPNLDREALKQAISDAFAARRQEVDTTFVEELTSKLEASLASSGVTVTSPKTYAQQLVDNLGKAAQEAVQQR